MSARKRFSGRTILVTGASRGIGEAVARAASESGARVALTARDAARLRKIALDLGARGREARAFPADARDERAVARVVASTRRRFGAVDGAVINQGVNHISPVAKLTTADWRDVVDTNLTASFFFARALARLDPPPRAIVLVSSVSALPGHRKFPGFAAYAVTKRGLLGLAEVLAVELADRGTRVHAVCPRGVDTAMFRETFPGSEPELQPEAVATAILDLLDSRTSPPTGAVIEL